MKQRIRIQFEDPTPYKKKDFERKKFGLMTLTSKERAAFNRKPKVTVTQGKEADNPTPNTSSPLTITVEFEDTQAK